MSPTSTENELLDLEHQFWTAIQNKDADAARALSDSSCIVVGAQGVGVIGPARIALMAAESAWKLLEWNFDPDSIQIRVLDDSVALLAYRVCQSVVVDGKPLILHANESSVWVRRGDRWLCAMHTESPAGDPFGRDRLN